MRETLIERRKSPRANIGLLVQYKQKDGNWDICVIKDFSETGLCLTSQTRLEAGAILMFRMKIPLDPREHIMFFAKALGCQALGESGEVYLVRAELTNISDSNKLLIKMYMDWFYENNKDQASG